MPNSWERRRGARTEVRRRRLPMNSIVQHDRLLTRRHFFGRASTGIGVAALASLLSDDWAAASGSTEPARRGLPGLPHFKPRARRVIYLFQSGAPSQMDLFDYKPLLDALRGSELPATVRLRQPLTGMT